MESNLTHASDCSFISGGNSHWRFIEMKRISFIIAAVIFVAILPSVVSAAFPHTELANGATLPGGGTFNLPMPTGAGGIQSGDLLVIVFAHDAAGMSTSCDSINPAWTFITGTGGYVEVCAKIADGSETQFSRANPSGLIAGQSYRVVGWRGAPLGSGSISATAVRVIGGTPDPPSHNPSGWDIEETLWLSGAAMANNAQGRDITGPPTGWTDLRYDDGTQQSIRSATLKSESASQDPGAFQVSENPASWQAWTISIRPSATEPLVTLAASGVTHNRAQLNGRLDVMQSAQTEVWFEYGTNPTLAGASETSHQVRSSTGAFSAGIGVSSETTYYFRARSLDVPGGYNATGEILNFTTQETPQFLQDAFNAAYVLGYVTLLALFLIAMIWIRKRRTS